MKWPNSFIPHWTIVLLWSIIVYESWAIEDHHNDIDLIHSIPEEPIEVESSKLELKVIADPKDWIIIDKSFPKVEEQARIIDTNELQQDSRRFFYSLGLYEVGAHKMTNETITNLLKDYDQSPFERLIFHFKIWYNQNGNTDVKCTRSYYVYGDKNELPLENPEQWVNISRTFVIDDRQSLVELTEKSLLTMNNLAGCENSILALKEVRLSYDHSSLSDQNDTMIINELQQPSKSIFNINKDTMVGSLNLYECSTKNCSFRYDKFDQQKRSEDVQLFRCHYPSEVNFILESKKELIKDKDWKSKSDNNCYTVFLTTEGLEKINKTSLTIKIQPKDDGIVAFDLEDFVAIPNNIDGNQFMLNESPSPKLVKIFIEDCKKKNIPLYFWHKTETNNTNIESATIIHEQVDLNINNNNPCLEIAYIVDRPIQMKIWLQINHHTNPNKSQLYNLHEYQQFNHSEILRFCPTDFIRIDPFTKPKGQLYIQLHDNDKSENLVFIAVTNEKKSNERKTSDSSLPEPSFFPLTLKDNKKYPVWSKSIMPISDIEVGTDGANLNMKNLKSATKYFVSTAWLFYKDNHLLTLRPLILSLSSQVKEIRAKLCDVTSLCIQSMQKSSISIENLFQYSFQFEPHPNSKSSHLNLHIEFITESSTDLTIKMISFGNPCQPNPICVGNSKCDESSEYVRANDVESACSCIDGWWGDDCNQVDHCFKLTWDSKTMRCINFANEAEIQCDNKSPDEIIIYNSTEKKCHQQKQPKPEENGKKFILPDTSLIDIRLYDICVLIQNAATNKTESVPLLKLKFQLDKQVLLDADYLDGSQSYNLCLSHYLNLTALYWNLKRKLLLHIQNTDNKTVTAKVAFYNPPLNWEPSIRSINKMENVHSIGTVIESFNITDRSIQFKSETEKQVILITQWFENPYSILGEQETDQKIRIEFGKPDRRQVCFATVYSDCSEFDNPKALIRLLKDNSDYGFHFEFFYDSGINKTNPFEVSILDPCWHDCSGYGECTANGFQNYRCNCDDGHYGDKCQLTKCKDDQVKQCHEEIDNESKCVPITEEKFECECPVGYRFDQKTVSCRQAIIKRKDEICGTMINGTSPQCFLQNLAQNMKYLPSNFPRIDQSLFKSGQPPVYYTAKSGSRIQIEEISLPNNLNDEDICLHFRYFLAGQNARLNLTMMANDDGEQNLFQIAGIEMLAKTKEIAHDDQKMLSLSSDYMEKLCIKEMIGRQQIEPLKSMTLVATLNDHLNDLTLIQISGIHTQPIGQRISDEPWPYISRTKSGLKQWKNANINSDSDFWPLQFPNGRWKNEKPDSENETSIISLSPLHSQTTGFAQLETQLLRRTINERTVMAFKLNSKTPNYLKRVHIELYDQHRQPLYNMGTYHVCGKEDSEDHKDEHDMIVLGEKKVINVSKLNINNETLYKVVIQFYFDDPVHQNSQVKRSSLFDVMDFTFGDPCVKNDGEDQICYNLEAIEDPNIKCFRNVSIDRTEIDYQCDCDFKNGAKGRNCKEKNYCLYRHIKIKSESHNITGDQYCKNDDAECYEGRFQNFEFLCTCKNESLWFKMDERKCRPVQPCLLDMPGQLDRRQCRDNDKTRKCDCNCKIGYEPDPKDPENQCVVSNNDECSSDACPDHQMKCMKQGSNLLCKCPQGFKFDGIKCKPDLCLFPSMNPCQQKCTSIDKEPFFRCECNKEYYETEDKIDPITNITYTGCKLRNNVPKLCEKCTGANQLCNDGQCQCRKGFEPKRSSDGQMECIIKDLKMACPLNKLRIDSLTNRTFCDCTHKDLTDWWQQSNDGSCTLVKTACDENEKGDQTCRRYGALCILDSERPDNFECLCPQGYMFSDKTQSKKDSSLIDGKCYPVCELPYYEQICSAIGGRCNPSKLWKYLHSSNNHEKMSTEYCDCIPGLFRRSSRDGDVCEQVVDATAYHMKHTWTVQLQSEFESRIASFNKLLGNSFNYSAIRETSINKKNRLDYIDPINWAQAQIRSLKMNEERNRDNQQKWNALIRQQVLRDHMRIMMENFKVVEEKYHLDLVGMDPVETDVPDNHDQYQVIVYIRDRNADLAMEVGIR